MNKKNFVALPIFNVLLILAQAATFWLWSNGFIGGFKSMNYALGNKMPTWTDFVFSTWEQWWLVPVICLFLLILVLFNRHSFLWVLTSFLTSLVAFLSMWYAMYPIHAMQSMP